jgi:hypothetical protein
MMSRDLPTTLIVIGLALYGIYIGLYIPPLLVGTPPLSILFGFLVQTVAALLGAIGVAGHRSWAPLAIVVLGAAIAATSMVEGFFLGIISYNHAVSVGALGLIVTILTAIYVSRREGLRV